MGTCAGTPVDHVLRHAHVRGKSAVHGDAQPLALGALDVGHELVALLYPLDILTHLVRHAGELVALGDGRPVEVAVFLDQQVAAADAGGIDLHEDLVRPDLRHRHFLQRYIARTRSGLADGWHHCTCHTLASLTQ